MISGQSQQRPATGVRVPAPGQLLSRPSTGLGGAGFGCDAFGGARQLTGGASDVGRFVRDAAFYAAQIRKRSVALASELSMLRGAAERSARKAAETAETEGRLAALAGEVHELENKLADINLATDKLRSGMVSKWD